MFIWWNKLLGMAAASFCVPRVSSRASCLCGRLSKISRWVWRRFLSNFCLCPGSQCMWTFVWAFWERCLYFPQPSGSPESKPLGLQSQTFWGLIFLGLALWSGECDVGLTHWILFGRTSVIIPVCVLPTCRYVSGLYSSPLTCLIVVPSL